MAVVQYLGWVQYLGCGFGYAAAMVVTSPTYRRSLIRAANQVNRKILTDRATLSVVVVLSTAILAPLWPYLLVCHAVGVTKAWIRS